MQSTAQELCQLPDAGGAGRHSVPQDRPKMHTQRAGTPKQPGGQGWTLSPGRRPGPKGPWFTARTSAVRLQPAGSAFQSGADVVTPSPRLPSLTGPACGYVCTCPAAARCLTGAGGAGVLSQHLWHVCGQKSWRKVARRRTGISGDVQKVILYVCTCVLYGCRPRHRWLEADGGSTCHLPLSSAPCCPGDLSDVMAAEATAASRSQPRVVHGPRTRCPHVISAQAKPASVAATVTLPFSCDKSHLLEHSMTLLPVLTSLLSPV